MPEVSVFRGVLLFLDRLGIYDVVLPFLLVFSIMFAILEKTQVLGTEKIGEKKYSRKNVNAMVSFVIGFMVIASAQLVDLITDVSSQVVMLLLLSVFFLLLVGSFFKQSEEGVFLEKGWKVLFMVIMFVGIVLVFLEAIKLKSGQPFLEWLLQYVGNNFSSNGVASLILLLVVVLLVWFITHDTKGKESKEAKA